MFSKARKNFLSRLSFELVKIDFAMLVVGPFLKPEVFSWRLVTIGAVLGVALVIVAFIFVEGEDYERRP